MKRILLFPAFILLVAGVFAQSPQKISYQAIIRDAENHLVTEQIIGVQISILQETADGTEVYIETQTPETNANGLISIEIGSGTIVNGDFAAIDWSNGPYFIKTEVDPEGGDNYSITGVSQILSVPYAMYANKAGNTFSGDYNDLINQPGFTGWDTNVTDDFDGDYSNLTNTPDFTDWDTNAADDFSGSYNDLSDVPANMDTDATDDFDGQYNNLSGTPENLSDFTNDEGYITEYTETDPVYDASPASDITNTDIANWNTDISETNELQILSISNDTLFLSDGGFVVLPADSTNSLDAAYDKGRTIIADTGALVIAGTDGFISSGTFGEGDTLSIDGAGTRMMWFPKKSAFRVGTVTNPFWDADSIGNYTFATGYNTMALGSNSTAMGYNSIAYSNKSTAIGYNANASGYAATCIGWNSKATGSASVAIGRSNTSIGNRSIAMGLYSTSESYASFAIGRYNVGGGDPTTWVDTDPLFEIGNGTSEANSTNALTVYKNGTIEVDGQIKNVTDPSDNQDAATKNYVDSKIATYSVGDFAQGGVVFYVDETGQHGLVCAIEDQGGGSGIRWYAGTYGVTRATGDGVFAGELNTAIIISSQVSIGDDGSDYAAQICNDLQITEGGNTYGDWYLPSRYELNLMYTNKSTINATATANGGSSFTSAYYWSSSEYSSNFAWAKNFHVGSQNNSNKGTTTYRVRAVRAF